MPTRRNILTWSIAAAVAGMTSGQAVAERFPVHYGILDDVEGPTEADLYVSPEGDDSAEGSLARPLRSIQTAVDRLSRLSGGRLAIRGGTYREQVNLDLLRGTPERPYIIHRYGRERVTITASETVTNWRPATEDERRQFALPRGAYASEIAVERILHGAPLALNLHRDARHIPVASDRNNAEDALRSEDWRTFHEARFVVNAEDRIIAIQDDRLVGINPAHLRQARVKIYHFPNFVSNVEIATVDSSTGTIRLAEANLRAQRSGDTLVSRYALENIGTGLGPDRWIVRQADRLVTLFYLPPESRPPSKSCEVSLRPTCIELGGASHICLFGIEAQRAAGAHRTDGVCIRSHKNHKSRGVALEHCHVEGNASLFGRGYGAIYLRNISGLRIHNLTVRDVRGAYGLFLNGCDNVDMRRLYISKVSQSPARFYALKNAVLAFSLFESTGWSAHANKFNFYEGCDQVLVYGVKTLQTKGYVTYQESSRIHFAFCDFDCDPDAQNRALVSQNRQPGQNQGGPDGSGEPVTGETFYYWNLTLRVDPRHANAANSLALGPERTSQSHAVYNSILHGGGFSDVYRGAASPDQEVRTHNRYTGLAFWQAPKYGWRLGNEEEQMRIGTNPGSHGKDMRPIIAELAYVFPDFGDWDRDIDGNLVDWTRAPIGAARN